MSRRARPTRDASPFTRIAPSQNSTSSRSRRRAACRSILFAALNSFFADARQASWTAAPADAAAHEPPSTGAFGQLAIAEPDRESLDGDAECFGSDLRHHRCRCRCRCRPSRSPPRAGRPHEARACRRLHEERLPHRRSPCPSRRARCPSRIERGAGVRLLPAEPLRTLGVGLAQRLGRERLVVHRVLVRIVPQAQLERIDVRGVGNSSMAISNSVHAGGRARRPHVARRGHVERRERVVQLGVLAGVEQARQSKSVSM